MSKYSGPFWAYIHDETGMPLKIEKCMFQPTIYPYPNGSWCELHIRQTEKDELETLIRGHMEAMKPLLDKWSKL